MRRLQIEKYRTLYEAARKVGRELLIEIICGKHGEIGEDTVARAMDQIYAEGIKPDWWKLEPQKTHAAWTAIEASIEKNDPLCRGIVLLGLDAPEEELAHCFHTTAGHKRIKGFAVGRTIFGAVAQDWFAGKLTDDEAVSAMADKFGRLVKVWQSINR
jgi:5-dehydro-2-deoxygluconokinase